MTNHLRKKLFVSEYEILREAFRDRKRMYNRSLDDVISYILLRIQCNSSLTGYYYIHEAIRMIVLNPEYSSQVAKYIYPKLVFLFSKHEIVKTRSVSINSVERNIRFCIESIWTLNNGTKNNYILSLLFKGYSRRPNNSVFLCGMSDYIRLIHDR